MKRGLLALEFSGAVIRRLYVENIWDGRGPGRARPRLLPHQSDIAAESGISAAEHGLLLKSRIFNGSALKRCRRVLVAITSYRLTV